MKAKKLLIWTWVGLVLLVFTGAARADSFFDILTPADWEENLYAGHLRTMTELEWGDYMFDWNNPDFVEGEPYLFNEYQSPGLYVYEGSDPDWPDDSGLVMYWGNEDLPTGSYSAAWMYDYKEDPDLSNSTITITVVPPQFDPALIPPSQINVVSVGMQDINGNKRAWYWNCPVPIAWNIPTKITINTAMAGPGAANPAASSYMSNPLFDITKVQFIIVDENAQWVGGGKPVPLPGTTVAKPWNLWENLSVNPNPTNPIAAGINIDIHQDISPNDTGGVLPNDFHIEGSIESGDPNDPAIPGSGEWSDPPVLTKHIDFDGMFPFFKYKIVPDPSKPGENWYKFVADWYGAEIPHCHILHLGLEFDATCHNVIIDLVGWWTRDGQRLVPDPPAGGPPGNGGFIPIPGFRVEDGIVVPPDPGMPPHQSLLLRNGNGNGVPEEGEINVKIIQMDLVSVPPIEIKHELGDDPLSQLRLGGMQESLPWVPVWLNNDPISPGNPLDFPAESFFDITFEVEIPPPTDHPYLEHSIVVESGGLLIARELLAFVGNDGITQEERWVWELHEAHWFDSDLGDAPDSTNSWFAPMTAYPWGTPASFPTVYGMGSPPHGPIHWFPFQMAYLGNNVTMEVEADLPPDMDPTTNIIPPPNQSDLDVADDGVLNIPLNLPRCIPVSFRYNVNIVNVPAGATLYANVWFDWDRSGDWNQKHTCINPGDAPEWAVQNQDVLAAIGMAAPAAGIYTITTPKFLPWHPPGADRRLPIWMRITLSETPWVGSAPPTGGLPDAGSGPPGGYLYGETEDYFFIPKKICCIDCPDFNGDGIVNMIDFAYFAAAWLKTCVIN